MTGNPAGEEDADEADKLSRLPETFPAGRAK